jgi:hypothetical protein
MSLKSCNRYTARGRSCSGVLLLGAPMPRFLGHVFLGLCSLFALNTSAQIATTTAVTASPTSGPYGMQTSIVAGVAPTTTTNVTSLPTGTVQFLDGTNSLSTTPVTLTLGSTFTTTPFNTFFGALDPRFATVTGQLDADLNGDGIQDLLIYAYVGSATAFEVGVAVQTFLANTKGGYSGIAAQTLTLPPLPTANDLVEFAPVLADLNGDGKVDLLIGQSIAYGNGDGTFQQPVTLSFLAGGYLNTFAADVNGDGKADIVAVNTIPNLASNSVLPLQMTIFINQGAGSFQSAGTYAISSGQCTCELPPLVSLNFADLNGDGKLDIVAQSLFLPTYVPEGSPVPTQAVTTLLNHGDGTFATAVPAKFTPQDANNSTIDIPLLSLQVADFNADGKMDLALPYPSETLVSGFTTAIVFLPGNGDGTFGAETDSIVSYPMVEQGPEPAAPGGNAVAADANLDGSLDLIFASAAVALGNGKGAFSAGNPIRPQAFGIFGQSLGLLEPAVGSLPYLVFPSVSTTPLLPPFVATYNVLSAASLAPPPLAVGTHSITAMYSGDTHYLPSTSPPTVVTVTPLATTVTASASANPSYVTQSVSFAAAVSSMGAVATGTVTLGNGSTTLATGTLDETGKTTISTTFSTAGTASLTATYGGDANHSAATTTLAQTIMPAFALQPGTGSAIVTVLSGQSASTQVSITGAMGYSGAVNLTCNGLPLNASCTFNPAALNLAGGIAQTSTLTVSTKATTTAGMATPWSGKGRTILSCGIFAGSLLLLWLRRPRPSWMAILLVGVTLFSVGCGGNSSSTTSGNTPSGTYSFSVVATAGTTQTTTPYTLTVQ